MGHSSCCPRMLVLQFTIVILVFPNTCTSDKTACLTLQVLLVAVVCYSVSTQNEPRCMLTTCVCNAWRFSRTLWNYLSCSGITWTLLFLSLNSQDCTIHSETCIRDRSSYLLLNTQNCQMHLVSPKQICLHLHY